MVMTSDKDLLLQQYQRKVLGFVFLVCLGVALFGGAFYFANRTKPITDVKNTNNSLNQFSNSPITVSNRVESLQNETSLKAEENNLWVSSTSNIPGVIKSLASGTGIDFQSSAIKGSVKAGESPSITAVLSVSSGQLMDLSKFPSELASLFLRIPSDEYMQRFAVKVQKIYTDNVSYITEVKNLLVELNKMEEINPILFASLSKIVDSAVSEASLIKSISKITDNLKKTGSPGDPISSTSKTIRASGGSGDCYGEDSDPNNHTNGSNVTGIECCSEDDCDDSCEEEADGHNYIWDQDSLDCSIDN